MQLKHGIVLSYEDASLLLELADYRIGQLKSEIKSRGLNAQSYKSTFRRLYDMRERVLKLRMSMENPNGESGVVLEGEKSE